MRPVDPKRDMAGLADVIEAAFADSLDAPGRRMVNEMRRYGRLGWLGWLAGHLILPPAAYPEGFVWVDGRRIVGNASLMAVQGAPTRWVLANVAVLPDFRRRGIARALVQSCIELAQRRRLKEIVLQVKDTNAAASDLYRRLGFGDVGTRVAWRLSLGAWRGATGGQDPARKRQPEEWQAHYELARRLAPAGVVWPHPLRPSFFRPPAWPSSDVWSHWVWPAHGTLQAALSARSNPFDAHQLFLMCLPDARGRAETPLLEAALAGGPRGGWIVLEADADDSSEALRRFGFREEQHLTWMRMTLAPRQPGGTA
jgi:ribosomal protein S18 acetylase RimI-like enzyme